MFLVVGTLGAAHRQTFDAIALVHEQAQGRLREIDRLCTDALKLAARRKLRVIDREIIARVLAAHPKLKADTIRKRVTAGFRTWRLLGQSAAAGAAARRDRIRSAIHRVYGRDR
jgi:hypothetical protein